MDFTNKHLQTFKVTALILVYKEHGPNTIVKEYIISMCFTEVPQHSPLLTVNMTTELICHDATTIL